jgi:thiol-disulfide isomerase/thioredoxin
MRMKMAALAYLLTVSCTACGAVDAQTIAPEMEVGQWLEIPPVPVRIPEQAPVIAVEGVERSHVPTLVNVWSSACRPCRKELPLLEEVAASTDIDIVGLSRDANARLAGETLQGFGVTYPNYLDTGAEFAIQMDGAIPLNQVPVTVLVVDGQARAVHLGPLTSVRSVSEALRTMADHG